MKENSNIICISGKQYSGKDALAAIMLEFMPEYTRIGIGDAIKLDLAKKKNIKVEEIYKNKHLFRNELIELGNWGREQDPDYWLKNLLGYDNIIVPDLRVTHEVEFFKEKGAILIRVEATVETRLKRGQIIGENDVTEVDLDNYKNWDYIIDNNSDLDTLKYEAQKLCKSILRKNY